MKKQRLKDACTLFMYYAFVWAAVSLLVSCGNRQEKKSVRLLYWNIQNGMWSGQGDNYDRFVEWVKMQNPDICVWCEGQTIYNTGTAGSMEEADRYLVNNWEELANRYGHTYWYVGAHRDNYPQVITSKYPINNIMRIMGSEPDSVVTHGAAWVQVDVAGQTINVVSLHTWPMSFAFRAIDTEASKAEHGGDQYRRKELEYICKHTIGSVHNADSQYWMMMGDFNSPSRSDNAVYNYPDDDTRFLVCDYVLENTPYVDIIEKMHPGEFLRTTGNGKRIDFIYCNPRLYEHVVAADVITDDYTTPVRDPAKLSNFWHPSDHCPILVDFDLEKGKQ